MQGPIVDERGQFVCAAIVGTVIVGLRPYGDLEGSSWDVERGFGRVVGVP